MRFAADFQSIDDGDTLVITFDDVLDGYTPAVLIGERVDLDDLEGHTARARVVGIENDLIDVVVDLSTWTSSTTRWDADASWQSHPQHRAGQVLAGDRVA